MKACVLSDQAAASILSMLYTIYVDIAAEEGEWAFHAVQKNHSFRSNDYASY